MINRMCLFGCMAGICLMLAGSGFAGSFIWNAASSGRWEEPVNWSPKGVPGNADIAVFSRMSSMTCMIDKVMSVGGVNVSTGFLGLVIQKQDVTVSGDFKVEGEALRWRSDAGATLSVGGECAVLGKGSAMLGILNVRGGRTFNAGGAGVRILNAGLEGGVTKLTGVNLLWLHSLHVGPGSLDLGGAGNYLRICSDRSVVRIDKGASVRNGWLYLTPTKGSLSIEGGGSYPGIQVILAEESTVSFAGDIAVDGGLAIDTQANVTNAMVDTAGHALTLTGDLKLNRGRMTCRAGTIDVKGDMIIGQGGILDAGDSQWRIRGKLNKAGQLMAGTATVQLGSASKPVPLSSYRDLVEQICGKRPDPAGRIVVDVRPDKVLYEPGDTAQCRITVNNLTSEPVKGKLAVAAFWEMEDMKWLSENEIEIQAGEKMETESAWPELPNVLGCEVRAYVMGEDGAVKASGSDCFNVCPHLEMIRVGIHASGPLCTYSDQSFLDTIPGMVEGYRDGYVNIVEYFPGKGSLLNLAPQEEEYVGNCYWCSNKALKLLIQENHRYGQKAVCYITSYTTHSLDDLEVSRRHPEWLGYCENGQPSAGIDVANEDYLRNPKRNQPAQGCFVSCPLNWMNEEALSDHIQQLLANKKMYEMDGVRYDGDPGAIWAPFDIEGKPQPKGESAGKERIRLIRHIREQVRKAYPGYLFMFNSGKAVGSGRPVDLVKGVLAPENIVTVEDSGGFCDEEVRGAYSTYNDCHEWKKFADLMVSDVDLTRKGGGFAYVLFPWASMVNVACDELGYSILLAAGDHPWFAYPGKDYGSNSKGGPHYPVQKELFAFATRFSAMLWGRGIDRVRNAKEVAEVSSAQGTIWWENFVHQRTLADGRKLMVVHLLNAPPTKCIEPEEQTLPEPIEGVEVKFKVPVKKVWLASPHPMTCGEVECRDGVVKVPVLAIWSMLVAEVETKGTK